MIYLKIMLLVICFKTFNQITIISLIKNKMIKKHFCFRNKIINKKKLFKMNNFKINIKKI